MNPGGGVCLAPVPDPSPPKFPRTPPAPPTPNPPPPPPQGSTFKQVVLRKSMRSLIEFPDAPFLSLGTMPIISSSLFFSFSSLIVSKLPLPPPATAAA